MKRTYVIFVMLSMVISGIFPFLVTEDARGAVLTVASDGSAMYTSIQAAVDAASPGDEITVAPGSYSERVFINTSGITIRGLDPMRARVFPGTGAGFTVRADNVSLRSINVTGGNTGVDIRGCNGTLLDGLRFFLQQGTSIEITDSDNITVLNEFMEFPNAYGIRAGSSSNITISGGVIFFAGSGSVRMDGVRSVVLSNFNLTTQFGIPAAVRGDSSEVEIRNCTMSSGVRGLFVESSRGISVLDCDLGSGYNSTNILGSANISLENCTIRGASLGPWVEDSSFVSIGNCTVRAVSFPLYLSGSDNVSVTNGSFNSSSMDGMISAKCRNLTFGDNELWNTGIVIRGDEAVFWDSHDISTTNRVNGRPVLYHSGSAKDPIPGSYGQVIVANCTSVTLGGMLLNGTPYPLQVGFSNMVTLLNMTVRDCTAGAFLRGSDSTTLADSTFFRCEKGIELLDSHWNWIYNCTVYSGDLGIIWDASSNNTLFRCSLGPDLDFGIDILSTVEGRTSDDNVIRNCSFSGIAYLGVNLKDSLGTRIVESDFSDSMWGLWTSDGDREVGEITVEDSSFTNLSMGGVRTGLVYDVLVSGCHFGNCGNATMAVGSSGFEFSSNILRDNYRAFHMLNVNDVLIYNNLIVNSHPGDVLFHDIRWNISRTPGENIIGGPYLGGNYWSDYNGRDLDGDGIGDEDVPFGPGDHLPLQYDLVPPTIEDVTEGYPTTGDVFGIRARPRDERGEVHPTLEYWFGDDTEHINGSMVICDPWGLDIEIPADSLEPLHYICSVMDSSGNWNSTGVITRAVRDNDPPAYVFVDYHGPVNVSVDTPIEVGAAAFDNISLGEGRLYYTDTRGIIHSTPVDWSPAYAFEIPGQESPGVLSVWINASDSFGNFKKSDILTINIVDDILPFIELLYPENGDVVRGVVDLGFNVSDIHSGVSGVRLEVTNDDSGIKSVEYDGPVPGSLPAIPWNTTVYPDGSHTLEATVFDGSGNSNRITFGLIVDNTPPEARAGEDVTVNAGAVVHLDGSLSWDGIGMDPGSYVWSFEYGGEERTLKGVSVDFTFLVPGVYVITLNVSDLAGNVDTDTLTVTVSEGTGSFFLTGSNIADGDADVPTDASLVLDFSLPVNAGTFGHSISVSPAVSYHLSFAGNDTRVTLEFPYGLDPGVTYTVSIDSARSAAGILLQPSPLTISFTTIEVYEGPIEIDIMPGNVVRGRTFTVSGRAVGAPPGSEVTVTIGEHTFSTVTGDDGGFELEVVAPDEIGAYAMTVSCLGLDRIEIVNVVERKETRQDNTWEVVITIFLIVVALILAAYIWVRRGSRRDIYIEE